MSDIVKDRAVVLKTYEYGESSIVAVALTRSHGKVRFLAKGARNSKSALQGIARTGNVCDVVLYYRSDRGLQVLKELEPVASFETSNGDLERLCLFQAGLEIVDRSIVEREAGEEVFDLMEMFMRLLPAAEDPWALFFAFEIGVLKASGSFPSTAACGCCRKPIDHEAFAVEPASGLVRCRACGNAKAKTLSAASSSFIACTERLGVEAARGASLGRAERKEIGELIHRVFASHIDGYRLPYALRFCKGVNGQ